MTTTQLTRREVLSQGLRYSALGAVFLTGCGGFLGGGGGGGATTMISGNLVVPPGLLETDLLVIGSGNVGQVASGAFKTAVNANSPSWVLAMHAPSGKVVGMGIVDKADHAPKIDATSAAEALLFMALDGSALPADGRKVLLDLIRSASATATLAGEIQDLLNADPYALETASPTLQNAVATVATSISSSMGMSHHKAKSSDTQDLATLMLVEPSNEVDGLTMVQADTGLAYQVQNARRRNSIAYTYLVAHVDINGTRTDITPEQVGSALEIPATNSLLNLSSGWHPKTSLPVPLKLQGQDKKSIYEVVTFNVVFGANDPAIYDLERYTGVVDNWKQSVRDLHAGMLLSYVTGIMFDAIGIGGLTFGIAELTATISKLTAVSTNLTSLLIGAQDGFALIPLTKAVIDKFLTGSFLSPDGIRAFEPLLAKAEGQVARDLAVGQASSSVYAAMRSALRIFLAVGAIGLAADLVAVGKDTSTGERGDLFTVTLFEPKVGLVPNNGSYTPGTDKSIEAQAPGVPQNHLSYHWKLTGSNLANLSDGTHVGNDFTSTSKIVNLATTPSTQGTLTVTVTITDTSTSTVLGTATASYTAGTSQDYTYILQPFNAESGYPQGGGVAVGYIPVTLTTSQQIVQVTGTSDNGGSIRYKIKLPPASTPINHTTKPVQSQVYGGTLGIAQGTIYDYHFTEDPNGGGNFIIWWNYGDEIWLVAYDRVWNNAGASGADLGNSADALAAVKAGLAPYHLSVTPI